jgi:PAS domain S-box-containing protein
VAQQRLKFLETLLDTLPNPIFYKDAEGYYTGCNNAFTAMTGFSTADIQGKTVFDIAPPEIAERYHEKDLELLRDGGTQRYEWQVTDSTGNLRDVIFDKAAIVDENNNISGIIGILSDITERKKAEELRIAKEAADEAAESKARFFAKASHELRSPLNSIIGFTEALADGIYGALNEKQSKALSNVMESGHLLKQLINDLLDLSKIEAGKTELDISEIELRSWIEEAVQVVQGNLLRKHQDVEMRFQEAGKDTRLPGDRRRLTQVMINLLTNASKFSPRDETIIVRAGFDDKLLRVDVCDAGIGIAKKTIETIFEPFCQGTSASDTQPGTGLGLSLAKEIVELHGGRMWAESPSPLHTGKRENPGSMFSFTIPLNQHNGEA